MNLVIVSLVGSIIIIVIIIVAIIIIIVFVKRKQNPSQSSSHSSSEMSILPIANGGTNSGTALVNGKIMMSNDGMIVEAPNIYSNGGTWLSIGAPLTNTNLGETRFNLKLYIL